MDNRIALVGIIVEDMSVTDKLNAILHDYSAYIVSRSGMPYRSRGICIITVILDAPLDVINTLSGKLGSVGGLTAKTLFTKV